jgi:pimeloyl-ACP methyl ester carboxylesterase
LQRDLGVTPVYARYNTGRRVFENGKLLAERLEDLVQGQADEIILVGHSMGGLVVRSACHHASQVGHAWVKRVSRVFCLGAPHQGAPLEKLGHLLTLVLGSIDHPLGRLVGDVLVRVGSASGPLESSSRAEPARAFRIETECFGGVVHHQLQNHPDVYALLRRACEPSTGG